MRVIKNADSTYTVAPSATETATLSRIEARFAPETAQGLLRDVVSNWLSFHEVQFKQEMLALYDTLTPVKQAQVRQLLQGP